MNTNGASGPRSLVSLTTTAIAAIVWCSCALSGSARANPQFFEWPDDRGLLPPQIKSTTAVLERDADVSELDRFLTEKSRRTETFVGACSTGQLGFTNASPAAASEPSDAAATAPGPESQAMVTTRAIDRSAVDGIAVATESHHHQALPAAAGALVLSVGAGFVVRRRLRT